MDETLQKRLAAAGRRGHRALAAGVIRGGEPKLATWAAEGPAPAENSLWEIGSITKAFTGVLLADMVQRGEVALDDPLSRHLPEALAWRTRAPTLVELATHRAGLPNVPKPLARRELLFSLGFGDRDPWAGVTASGYTALVRRQVRSAGPGGRPRYSSMGVGLLGDALAARAGAPYEQLLAERVLAPLGMTATTFDPQPDGALVGHSRRGRPRPPIQDLMPAAGSLRSTVADMGRFLAACLNPPDGAIAQALALAREPRARMNKHIEVGLCWLVVHPPRKPPIVWHNGGTWGFRSFAGFAPATGGAALVLSNSARGVDRIGLDLID